MCKLLPEEKKRWTALFSPQDGGFLFAETFSLEQAIDIFSVGLETDITVSNDDSANSRPVPPLQPEGLELHPGGSDPAGDPGLPRLKSTLLPAIGALLSAAVSTNAPVTMSGRGLPTGSYLGNDITRDQVFKNRKRFIK